MIASVARAAAPSLRVANKRTFISQTTPKLGEGHGPHLVFDGKPFSKAIVGGIMGTITILGIGIPLASVKFQNAKHGF